MHVANETVEGLGRYLFPKSFFGVLASMGQSPRPEPLPRSLEASSRGFSKRGPLEELDPQPHKSAVESPQRVDHYPAAISSLENEAVSKSEGLLTDLLPQSGYFLAGGIAGVVSRTATAPLDRLKVYLIAQTGAKSEAVKAIKDGAPVKALKRTSRPLFEATKSLWRMGGIRSLFAGKLRWHNNMKMG